MARSDGPLACRAIVATAAGPMLSSGGSSCTTRLITGTSSGIGRATAKHFQLKGWNVIATMRTPTPQDELAQFERTLVARIDAQDAPSIRSAIDAGFARFGRIDTLVNNAGYGAYGPLEARSPAPV